MQPVLRHRRSLYGAVMSSSSSSPSCRVIVIVIAAVLSLLAPSALAIIYDRSNVPAGALPPPLDGDYADFNIYHVGAGSSGSLTAPLLAQSNCLKVLVLDEADAVSLADPYFPTHPGAEYWSGGYYSGELEKMELHTDNPAIDREQNVHGSTWRTVPGGNMRLSHYAWESGDSSVHQRDMYEALNSPPEWSVQNTYVTIPNRRLNVAGPHMAANHANQGKLRVQESRNGVFQQAWLQACSAFTGYPIEYDFLKPQGSIHTCGAEPSNLRADGFRSITENEYLLPEAAKPDSNLVYVRGASVRRVIFEGTTAVGLEGAFYGIPFNIRFPARINLPQRHSCPSIQETKNFKRIVLSAGTIGNAHLLKLSGVGPAAELANYNIKVVVDNPHVGAHLKEGLVSYLGYSTNATETEIGMLDRNQYNDWITSRPAAFVEHEGAKYLFLLTPSSYNGVSAFALVFQMEQPLEGSVTLKSGNPEILPRVDYGWNEEHTIATHVKGLRYFRRLLKETSMSARFQMYEYFPGGEPDDYDSLKDAVRRGSEAILHATGTTRMAQSAADGVVNTNFEVFGTKNLLVNSVSVLRYFPGAGGQHWAVVVADILANKILASVGLPAAN